MWTGSGNETRAHLVVRNALINFAGESVLLLIGLLTLPAITYGLGANRFGVLILALAVLGYLNLFDLGLGRAVVKFVAEALSTGDQSQIARITWGALLLLFLFGAIGGVGLAVFTLQFVHIAFAIPQGLVDETRGAFLAIAATVPFMTCANGLQGVLHAVQRFDLANSVRVGSGIARSLFLAFAALAGWRLPEITLGLLLLEVVRVATYLTISLYVLPALRDIATDRIAILRLARFGGWLSVSSIVGMTIVYLDRFIIVALLTVSSLTYYAVPAEVITRLKISVTAVTAALFPVLSTDRSKRAIELYAHTTRLTLLVVIPFAIVLTVFGVDLLTLWMGPAFAAKGGRVLQFLAIGFALGAAGRVAHSFLLALGYPDIMAKFHLFELAAYSILAVLLTKAMQIEGMALAWTLRTALETTFVLVALRAKRPQTMSALGSKKLAQVFGAGGLLLVATVAVKLVGITPLLTLVAVGLCVACFALAVWRVILYPVERATLLAAVNLWRRPIG